RRERWGRLTYATAVLEALAKLEPVPVTLDLRGVHLRAAFDGAPVESKPTLTLECRAVQIAIVNMPVFGGRLNLMLPGAHPSDRLLDVVVIEALEPRALRETIEGLLAALGRLKDRLLSSNAPEREAVEPEPAAADASAGLVLPGVHRYQVRAVRLTTPSPVDITLDGEIRARTPLEIAVAPVPLRIILPSAPREAPTPPGFMAWVSRAPAGR
ncbi:MAG TPA: hypothetical protein VKC57_15895, partial [Ktedonobacterales bacterium]|nr:hypothetical protein [Ktedonobacterales bacterium]